MRMTLQAQPVPHRRIPAGEVRRICGDVSEMTIYRWLNRADLKFPKPVYIGRRRYWREAEIIEWLDAHAGRGVA